MGVGLTMQQLRNRHAPLTLYKGAEMERDDRNRHPAINYCGRRSGLMVYSRRSSGGSYFLDGQRSMEIAILILLSVSLTAALPLKQTHRSESDAFSKEADVQAVGVKRSDDTQQQHVPGLKIIPFISEGKYLDMDALKHRMPAKARLRRGCQLGTCQVHNLASTLYQMSKTSEKEESQKARDPQGFGR